MHRAISRLLASMSYQTQLVGTDRCIEILFPDAPSRPGQRTFLEWKARGYFRYHKIGKRVFYRPEEVASDLARRFRIEAVDPN